MDEKFFLKSTGVLGGILAILGALGVLNPEDVPVLEEATAHTVSAVTVLVGAVAGIYGRFKATKKLTVLPK